MTGAASLSWFAQHEFRLAWRDWSWFLSGGRRTKDIALLVGIVVFVAGFHGFAYVLLEPYLFAGQAPAKTILLPLSGAILLTFSMMLSQALEMVTRAFYARDDLDLILSSPAPADDLFVVRIAMLAFSNTLLNMALTAPFINAAAVLAGPQWLAAYGIVIAASLIATGTAVFLVLGLFLTVGAKRTRLIAQIIAAIVSASFLIGLQVIAIIVYGSMSRWDIMTSSWLSDTMPALDTAVWIPARAASGDFGALALVLIPALLFFALAARRGAKSFQGIVLSAAAVGEERASRVRTRPTFAVGSTHGALVRKEWKLLKRDAWMVSQTLMQVFYLIPPALMMWDSYGSNNPVSVILAPVIVMAIGQLAGGLAWLAISGEDAPDLIATAPITPFALLNAKVQAVAIRSGASSPEIASQARPPANWPMAITITGARIT
ncbi:MAG: permease, partial [Pseudomonadota bacterium]